MPGVGLSVSHQCTAPFVPAPHQGGIAFKCVRGRKFGGVEFLPKTGLLVAECWDATLRGNTGAGEDHHARRRTQGFDYLLVQVGHVPRLPDIESICAASKGRQRSVNGSTTLRRGGSRRSRSTRWRGADNLRDFEKTLGVDFAVINDAA